MTKEIIVSAGKIALLGLEDCYSNFQIKNNLFVMDKHPGAGRHLVHFKKVHTLPYKFVHCSGEVHIWNVI